MLIYDSTFDITNINKSYAIIDLELMCRIPGIPTAFLDPDHLMKVFVGFKSSNTAFREFSILSNGRDTKYHSNAIHYESFAYANSKCEAETIRKRDIYTL
jgi:hypothetical protein